MFRARKGVTFIFYCFILCFKQKPFKVGRDQMEFVVIRTYMIELYLLSVVYKTTQIEKRISNAQQSFNFSYYALIIK